MSSFPERVWVAKDIERLVFFTSWEDFKEFEIGNYGVSEWNVYARYPDTDHKVYYAVQRENNGQYVFKLAQWNEDSLQLENMKTYSLEEGIDLCVQYYLHQ